MEVLVETLGDRVEPQLLVVAPLGDQRHRLRSWPVGFQPGFRDSFLRLRGVWMAERLRLISVWWFADVVALPHVCARATPGQFQHGWHFILGDVLVDPPLQDLLLSSSGSQ